MANDIRLALTVQCHDCTGAHVFDIVSAEEDSLAEKVSKDVICADELHSPIESVKYVSLLGHELLICKWHANIL